MTAGVRRFGRGRHAVAVVPAEGGGWTVAVDGGALPGRHGSPDAAWAAGASEAARLDAAAGRLRREASGT